MPSKPPPLPRAGLLLLRSQERRSPARYFWFGLAGDEPRPPFVFAGLWRDFQPGLPEVQAREATHTIMTHTIITTTANDIVACEERLSSTGQDLASMVRVYDRSDSAEDFCGHAGCGVDQARQEAPEPCEQQAAVVADGAEDGVDGVAVMAVEVVSFEQTIGFHVAEHGLDAVSLQLHALAYNLANFLRIIATPEAIASWSLTSLRERLIKTGTRLVKHARYAVFRMAEAALPRDVFAGALGLINGLRGPPAGAASA